jgi:uncharacterized protein
MLRYRTLRIPSISAFAFARHPLHASAGNRRAFQLEINVLRAIFGRCRADVIARLKEAEPALRGFGVAGLYLFGSYARDEARPHSDIDVFVDKDQSQPFGFGEFMDAYLLLQERLGENIDYGTREGLHPLLRLDIEREAVRVF